MEQIILLTVSIISLIVGSFLGYYARQSIARRKIGSIEAEISQRISRAKKEADLIYSEAKKKASKIQEDTEKELEGRKEEIFKTQQVLLKRENILEEKLLDYERKEKEFRQNVGKLKEIKENLEGLKGEAIKKMERIAKFSQKEAKKELLENVEKEYQKEILEKIKRLKEQQKEEIQRRAKEVVALAIQKCALSQSQELTTTTVALPSDEIKGRIIGKEGRNIKTLERLTGVEIIVDDTPEAVIISGFDPIRRQIAKTSLEKLIQDGRIQPARIEEVVARATEEIDSQIKEAGETAVYETGIVGLDPKLIHLLGRLRFRTSYGQNVLLHSMEVSYLAAALAGEIGANVKIAQKAGLLHDIGKAVDWQVQGSHVDIGIKILEKFGVEKEVITAMKSHHEEYPAESIEAVLVQAADQISGARPGARKDTVENYLKRLEDLENIALSFSGVERAWALQAGRELRVFVKPEEINDLTCHELAREIANRVQEELKYPGEIKVTLIRENRIVEYAK